MSFTIKIAWWWKKGNAINKTEAQIKGKHNTERREKIEHKRTSWKRFVWIHLRWTLCTNIPHFPFFLSENIFILQNVFSFWYRYMGRHLITVLCCFSTHLLLKHMRPVCHRHVIYQHLPKKINLILFFVHYSLSLST